MMQKGVSGKMIWIVMALIIVTILGIALVGGAVEPTWDSLTGLNDTRIRKNICNQYTDLGCCFGSEQLVCEDLEGEWDDEDLDEKFGEIKEVCCR